MKIQSASGAALVLGAVFLAGCTLPGTIGDIEEGETPSASPPPGFPQPAATEPPDALPALESHLTSSAPTHMSIPSVSIDAPLDTVTSDRTDGGGWSITPPANTSEERAAAYWWSEEEYSKPPRNPSDGTSYIYAHACDGLDCAFDTLQDVHRGDTATVTTPAGELSYEITEDPLDLEKSPEGIGSSAQVYDYDVPGRLVLITCGYLPDGSSTFNWAVIADLVDG